MSPKSYLFSTQFLSSSHGNNNNFDNTKILSENIGTNSSMKNNMKMLQGSNSRVVETISVGGLAFLALLFSEIKETSMIAKQDLISRTVTNSNNSNQSNSLRIKSIFRRMNTTESLRSRPSSSSYSDENGNPVAASQRVSDHSTTSSKGNNRKSMKQSLLQTIRQVNEQIYSDRNSDVTAANISALDRRSSGLPDTITKSREKSMKPNSSISEPALSNHSSIAHLSHEFHNPRVIEIKDSSNDLNLSEIPISPEERNSDSFGIVNC